MRRWNPSLSVSVHDPIVPPATASCIGSQVRSTRATRRVVRVIAPSGRVTTTGRPKGSYSVLVCTWPTGTFGFTGTSMKLVGGAAPAT